MAAVRENLDHDYKIFLGGDEFGVPANECTTLRGLTGEITHRKYAATAGLGRGGMPVSWEQGRGEGQGCKVKEDKKAGEGVKRKV